MSWHSDCSTDYKNYGDPHMKPNRYAFVNDKGVWNCVKFGGNFGDKFWIVSDISLTQEQMEIVLDKMSIRPKTLDKLTNVRTFKKLDKHVIWFELEW